MWLYSSMEKLEGSQIETKCQEQVLEILRRVKDIEGPYVQVNGARATPGIVLTGSLNEKVLNLLEEQQRVKQATGPHFKFIFEAGNLPPDVALHSEDLVYSEIRRSDVPLVLSRTEIPRKERPMVLLPSLAVFFNNAPIAWGFLGDEGHLFAMMLY
ncbi:hypothetical protein ONS95_007869 [Cadophora gregata]|uniref:uncharacterized protein n=1 Tax=Cadophora gregata TaxID=51156 RepID=UPI0026DAF1F3|nr:uncharacterized protein ONS95_007869 [Cadophora gregata]KAK0126256.1 hypothetical protein ONS95_007869 [Cadophora gregata]